MRGHRTGAAVVIVSIAAISSGLGPPRAEALASGCSLDPVTRVLTIALAPDAPAAVLRRHRDAIQLDGHSCAGALVTSVDTIRIGGAPTFVLDLGGGPFAPGATPESDGVSEIELEIATPALTIEGSPDPDLIAIGADGMALNADGDADATFVQPPDATVHGRGGSDHIFGLGAFGATGSAASLVADGGLGRDGISGSNGDDSLVSEGYVAGYGGNDVIGANFADGGPGDDDIWGRHYARGGDGNDNVSGGLAASLHGDAGNDTLCCGSAQYGDEGDDVLHAPPAQYHDQHPRTLDGGDGNDVLYGGPATDTLRGGAGDDTIYARDGRRDVVVGGSGYDRAAIDPEEWFVGSIEELLPPA
jgi:hypothetical protein